MTTKPGKQLTPLHFLAFLLMVLSLMACVCGGGEAIQACASASDSDSCSACCKQQGHTGHSFTNFGDKGTCKCY